MALHVLKVSRGRGRIAVHRPNKCSNAYLMNAGVPAMPRTGSREDIDEYCDSPKSVRRTLGSIGASSPAGGGTSSTFSCSGSKPKCGLALPPSASC
jgi:hypothetical protein